VKIVRRTVVADCPDFRMRILSLLDARYVDQAWLSRRLGMSPQRMGERLEQKSIDVVVVSEIERVLGVSNDFWTKPWSSCVGDLVRMKRETEAGLFKKGKKT